MVSVFAIFWIVAVLLLGSFFRFITVHFQLWFYLKKNHPDFFNRNITGMGKNLTCFWNAYDGCLTLNDPFVADAKKQHESRLKQFVLAIVLAIGITGLGMAVLYFSGQ
ncbi:hypothetical protein MJO47_05255 [Desulfuromonas sp. KJ2020]|uniref:hypothetical protein n=1 Tax=Desulfuromonas sp. KJ2020 TaxID=2919173 RepID=UPI0020A8333B|nr:hypothetical protein [Desulfuromonas sp. KJ2020]MCP3176503.1 hypothetical protein [Desulfuromonas sp. KJ2020]